MSAAESFGAAPSLVDLLLAEQRTLRAVDEFSAWHDEGARHRARFETLIPGALPGEGQQFAFAVDLDVCTGCKACVTACHSLNGLEVGETWRKVGELEGGGEASALHRQTVTAACHHCESPACLAGCPVRAYEKDAVTGIVIHLDDQCIGCRYCQLMCPYDVPQFSERLGIVRKCDMCHGRLAAGEAPACVQGCPNQAISIAIVEVGDAGEAGARAGGRDEGELRLLPVVSGGIPRDSLTRPTTRYVSARVLPSDLHPVESASPRPAEGHAPLAVMLVLMQASVGALAVDALCAAVLPAPEFGFAARGMALFVAALFGFVGLAASTFHLGRPQWAFRAFLGLRTSWMSREILAFGAYAGALVAALATSGAQGLVAAGIDPAALLEGAAGVRAGELVARLAALDSGARLGALAAGLVGLVCSVQIYAVTGRPLWRADRTALRFGGTLLLLGSAVAPFAWAVGRALAGAPASRSVGVALALPVAVIGLALAKRALERGRLVRGAREAGEGGFDEVALARTRALLAGALAPVVRIRRGLGALGGVGLPLVGLGVVVAGGPALAVAGVFACALCAALAGEVAERSLFFRSEAMRGMPGAFASTSTSIGRGRSAGGIGSFA